MNKLLTALTTEKGIKSYRGMLLAAVVYVAHTVNGLDHRLTVIETRLSVTHQAVTSPGTVTGAGSPTNFASVGPEWPQKAGSTFHR